MRASLLANDALRQLMRPSITQPSRRVRLNPRDFHLRLRCPPAQHAAYATQSLRWTRAAQPTRPSDTPVEPLIIEQRRDESRCGPSSFNGSEETQIKVNHSRATYWRDLRESGVSGKKLEAQEAVQNLIFHFGERPSVSMYAALIAAEADPQHGSAADVERLLGELDAEGLHRELEIYDAALKALSIHPDHVLRETLLEEMKRRWMELDENHWHYIVAGLLRERQVELALERLGAFRVASFQPRVWLLHLLITTCLSVSAFPEALSLLQYRASYPEPIPSALWSEAMSKAAESHCHPIVDYVWRRAVEPQYLNPSSGTCIAVLDTAARDGNFRLATDVIRVLGIRDSPLELWHYEALLEAYLHAGDLPSALGTLRVMDLSNMHPVAATLRPLYLYLRTDPGLADHTLAVLEEVAETDNFEAWDPRPVLNVCIESYMYNRDLSAALTVYRSWHLYSAPHLKPSIETFNALLFDLSAVAGKEAKRVAVVLRSELKEALLLPDAITNNRLISAFLVDEKDRDGLELALNVYEEMKANEWAVSNANSEVLIERIQAARDADPRKMEMILQEMLSKQPISGMSNTSNVARPAPT